MTHDHQTKHTHSSSPGSARTRRVGRCPSPDGSHRDAALATQPPRAPSYFYAHRGKPPERRDPPRHAHLPPRETAASFAAPVRAREANPGKQAYAAGTELNAFAISAGREGIITAIKTAAVFTRRLDRSHRGNPRRKQTASFRRMRDELHPGALEPRLSCQGTQWGGRLPPIRGFGESNVDLLITGQSRRPGRHGQTTIHRRLRNSAKAWPASCPCTLHEQTLFSDPQWVSKDPDRIGHLIPAI